MFGMPGAASNNKLICLVQVLITRMESAQTCASKNNGILPFFAPSLCSAASAAVLAFARRWAGIAAVAWQEESLADLPATELSPFAQFYFSFFMTPAAIIKYAKA